MSSTAGACGVTFLSYLSKLDVVLVIVILIRPKGTPLGSSNVVGSMVEVDPSLSRPAWSRTTSIARGHQSQKRERQCEGRLDERGVTAMRFLKLMVMALLAFIPCMALAFEPQSLVGEWKGPVTPLRTTE